MAGADAQAGFYYQNLVAALRTLDLIEFGSQVKAITLENPLRAPHIDDIIIETNERTEFIQVKWAEDEKSSYTLANLVAPDDTKPCLLRKLAIGYQKIANEPGSKTVVLLTTRRAGSSKQPKQGFEHSLRYFIEEFHEPFLQDTNATDITAQANFGEFQQTLALIQNAAELPDSAEFFSFLKTLRFQLGEPDRELLTQRLHARLQTLGIEERQFGVLLHEVVKWSLASTPYVASNVLQVLGLADRFSDRLHHHFPVDDSTWVKTPKIFEMLDNALNNLNDGFILVEGEPGAGKSTAITKYLQQRNEISFGYFCFIPDEKSIGNERLGEAAFLQSVCSGLKKSFPSTKFSTPYAQQDVSLLNKWLNELSASGERVVFVIDGLDHVDRKTKESVLKNPLTAILDGELPKNILVILTSRYAQAAPQSIVAHISRDTHRHIQVPRLDRDQIDEFFRLRGLLLKEHTVEQALQVSQGVPIYLEYLADKLDEMHEFQQEKYLASAPSLRNKQIDHFHDHIWQDVTQHELPEYILAILAIREEFSTPAVLRKILRNLDLTPSTISINKEIARLKYLLRTSEAKGVTIRHSSLTEFVAQKTKNHRDEIIEAIIEWYEQDPDTDEAWRNRFRFFLEKGEYQRILKNCHNDWFDKAWRAYRPLSEIKRNLNVAWRAAAELQDLVAFTRISLMMQRVGVISENIEHQETSIAHTLLDFGQTDIALNYVWDGEQPTVGDLTFAEFALSHKKQTDRQLPVSILRAGLRVGQKSSGNPESLATLYRAQSVIVEPRLLLAKIEKLKWHTKDHHSNVIDYTSAEGNQKQNETIQISILQGLIENGQIETLCDLIKSDHEISLNEQIIQLSLATAFARIEEFDDAGDILEELDWSQVPLHFTRWCCHELTLTSFSCITLNDPRSQVLLPTKFIKDHVFDQNLFELYQEILYFYFGDTTAQQWLDTALTKLPQPIKTIVSAMTKLADISFKQNKQLATPTLQDFIDVAEILDIDARLFTGRNDFDSGKNDYRCSAYGFYDLVWSNAKRLLTSTDFIKLAHWWQKKNNGQSSLYYLKATRALAFSLADIDGEEARQVTYELLQATEKHARQDEDTMVLTGSLLEATRAWGVCGFTKEAERVWREIPVVACGVSERKDYQFTEINTLIELAHHQDPANTMNRVIEQIQLAFQLEDTGSSKQLAISIEMLLKLVAKWWPGLAIAGLTHTSETVYRERAIGYLIKQLSNQPVDKQLLLAMVATMNHWKDYTQYSEETFPTMTALYEAALSNQEFDIARQLYDFARYMFQVEKQSPSDINHWAGIWQQHGNQPQYIDSDLVEFSSCKPKPNKETSAWDKLEEALLNEVSALDVSDTAMLESELAERSHKEISENRLQQLMNSSHDWLKAFKKLTGDKDWSNDDETFATEQLETFFKNTVTKINESKIILTEEIKSQVNTLFEQLNSSLNTQLTFEEFTSIFDLEAWLSERRHPSSPQYSYGIQKALETQLPKWIRAASFHQLDYWEKFCLVRCSGNTQTYSLLAVANRITKTNKDKAFSLLEKAMSNEGKLIFYNSEVAEKIFRLAIKIDKDVGIKLVLTSFVRQFSDSSQMVIYYLTYVIKWFANAVDCDYVALYGIWNEYNQQLTAGLTTKPVDTTWLTANLDKDFEVAAIEYLISLFHYPEIDIRLRSAEAVISIMEVNPKYIDLVKTCWRNSDDGEKEYIVSCFDSLGRVAPQLASHWGDWLAHVAVTEEHFNIRASAQSALQAVKEQLSKVAIEKADSLLEPPKIAVVSPLPTGNLTDSDFRNLPPYLGWVIKKFVLTSTDGLFAERVLSILLKKYPDILAARCEELNVHRQHNINDNFDTLEISGPYTDSVRAAINRALMSVVQSHVIDLHGLAYCADLLRLRDPSDSLYKKTMPPADLYRINIKQSDAEFLSFTDWNAICANFTSTNNDWVTLFEYTEDRPDNELRRRISRCSKTRIEVFGVPRGFPEGLLPTRAESLKSFHFRNLYRFEMNGFEANTGEIPITPLVLTNDRHYRGRLTIENAAITQNLCEHFPLKMNKHDPFGYDLEGKQVVRSIDWQGPYDQDRRLHEPRTSGFLLQIDRQTLIDFTESMEIDLWAKITVHRTTDQFMSEYMMNWERKEQLIRIG